jgi:hypothetical protein
MSPTPRRVAVLENSPILGETCACSAGVQASGTFRVSWLRRFPGLGGRSHRLVILNTSIPALGVEGHGISRPRGWRLAGLIFYSCAVRDKGSTLLAGIGADVSSNARRDNASE